MPEFSGDLRLEAIWAELGIMLACLAWLLGSRWKTPLETECLGVREWVPTCQQFSEPVP